MEIILVSWRDITAELGNWIKAESIKPEMTTVTSVGILVLENDEFIVLASDCSDDKHYNVLNYIPKHLVSRRETLAGWEGSWPRPKRKRKAIAAIAA